MSTGQPQKQFWTRLRNPVELGTQTDSDCLQHSLTNTRRKEAVMWILIALLNVLNIVAFYLIWLKASGSMAG
jgi:hypothetical protein